MTVRPEGHPIEAHAIVATNGIGAEFTRFGWGHLTELSTTFDEETWASHVACSLAQVMRSSLQEEPHMALLNIAGLENDVSVHEYAALALANAMGDIIPADADGSQIVHVYDQGDTAPEFGGVYRRGNTAHRPHTDNVCLRSDIGALILWCVRPAAEGGESTLIRARDVRQTLGEEHPVVADMLAESTWYFSTRGMGEKEEVFTAPILIANPAGSDECKARYFRDYIKKAHELAHSLLTSEQEGALDILDEVLGREELQLKIALAAGQVLITRDSSFFHARMPWSETVEPKLGRLSPSN